MATVETKQTHTVKRHTNYQWERLDNGNYQCGDVQLRHLDDKYPDGSWWYFVRVNGRWRKAAMRQRNWGYGHPSQAFVGFSQIREFCYE